MQEKYITLTYRDVQAILVALAARAETATSPVARQEANVLFQKLNILHGASRDSEFLITEKSVLFEVK